MTAFLAWALRPGGEGGPPGPRLEEDEAEVWSFYCKNANPFVQEFGLMPGLLGEVGLDGVARDMFYARLAHIHNAVLEARLDRLNKSDSLPPGTILAADPT